MAEKSGIYNINSYTDVELAIMHSMLAGSVGYLIGLDNELKVINWLIRINSCTDPHTTKSPCKKIVTENRKRRNLTHIRIRKSLTINDHPGAGIPGFTADKFSHERSCIHGSAIKVITVHLKTKNAFSRKVFFKFYIIKKKVICFHCFIQ